MFERIHDPAAVYNYIVAYKTRNDGNAPTMREIMDACNIGSTGTVSALLRTLCERGLIRLHSHNATRGIIVVGGKWQAPPVGVTR